MKKNIYWKLLKSTFILSAFTFGGGFVIVPLMKKKFVDELAWIAEEEMLDLVSIAQSSPGALTVNASILVGYKVRGIKGALTAVLGSILPPLFIISVIAYFYNAFITNPIILKVLMAMNIGIAAILIDVVIDLAYSVILDYKFYAIFIISAVIIAANLNIDIFLIVIVGGLVGLGYFTFIYKDKLFKEKN